MVWWRSVTRLSHQAGSVVAVAAVAGKGIGCPPRRAGKREVRFYGIVARHRRRICRALPRGLAADQMRCGHNHDRCCGTARVGAHLFALLDDTGPTQVVIISASTGETSSRSEENLSFVVDDAAKTLTFADGGSLAVTRLDRNWISANHDDIFYEFDRQGGTLSYASSTTKNNITSTIVGSGRCG